MRTPSRLMPKYKPQAFGLVGWLVLSVLACAGLYILWVHPILTVLAVILLIGLVVYEDVRAKSYFNGLMTRRQGESLCTFSREQDLRNIDTLIVRAVYEEIQFEIPLKQDFPLRWIDNLYSDLRIDSDSVEDLIARIAQRTGRSIKHTQLNPLYGKICTPGDLVIFFNRQPKDHTDPNSFKES